MTAQSVCIVKGVFQHDYPLQIKGLIVSEAIAFPQSPNGPLVKTHKSSLYFLYFLLKESFALLVPRKEGRP